ncbi:MAG: PAS domain-containing sensor histidine kinase [Gammaproteobacteria bacterium]|nr:PAS domain-containing sensor histidine kinase [Gammaproteobacteria bacterium]
MITEMGSLEEKNILNQIIDDFSQSLGREKAKNLIENSVLKLGLPIKDSYSNEEALKIFELIEKEQKGYIRTLAGLRMAQVILNTKDMRKINELIFGLQTAKTKLEEWSATLEEKVKDRTKDLARSYEEISIVVGDLEKSKQYIENIIANFLNVLIVTGIDGTIRLINDVCFDVLGYTKEELLGKNIELMGGKDKALILRQILQEGQIKNHECLCKKKDRTPVFVIFSGSLMKGKSEKSQEIIIVLQDITERKKIEDSLVHEKEFTKNILDNVQAVILILDQSGGIVDINRYMEKISGFQLDEVKGKDWFETFLPEENRHNTREIFKKSVSDAGFGAGGNIDQIVTKNGHVLDIEWYDKTLKDKYGNVIGLVALGRDVTEQRKIEEINRARMVAEEAYRTKSEFLANMSHELRTPLNSIIGFSEVLDSETFGPLNVKQKSYINYVLTSGQHLLLLVNDVLNLAKVEAGKMELLFTVFPVKAQLEESLALLKELLVKNGIEASLEVPEDIGNIEADKRRFKEMIDNLLSNAIKFTPSGGKIGIKAWRHQEEIEFEIWDTGVGIAAENMSKVFSIFTRIESAVSKATEGTGLGLPYTKKLVELHGGRIWIKSDGQGKGAQVSFTLPIKQKKRVLNGVKKCC